jgi:hypothetical protein
MRSDAKVGGRRDWMGVAEFRRHEVLPGLARTLMAVADGLRRWSTWLGRPRISVPPMSDAWLDAHAIDHEKHRTDL